MNIFEFVPPVEIHQDLNPKLWAGKDLRPDVTVALLNIAREFYDFLEVPVDVKDLIISGSQANYNYSPYSDLDLHLIVDYSEVECEMTVSELFDTKRKYWKEQRDIKVHGIPVELYVEDLAEPAVSSAYSILSRKWTKPPKSDNTGYNKTAVQAEVKKWDEVINHAIKSRNLEVCRKVREMLADYRKAGLAAGGEFSIQNLTYKSLRNSGKLGDLMDTIGDLFDKKLSI